MSVQVESRITRNQIIERFDKYDFKNKLGYPLTSCIDFQLLVDELITANELANRLEKQLCKRCSNA